VAVTIPAPTGALEELQVPYPEDSVTVQSGVEPIVTAALPEGVPPEPLTVTEYVTLSPKAMELAVAVRVVVVAPFTVREAVAVEPAKLVSPP
jgi:hypothetical protein